MAEELTMQQINERTNKFLDQYGKDVWNAAIEAAAKITEHSGYAEQIRKLKK